MDYSELCSKIKELENKEQSKSYEEYRDELRRSYLAGRRFYRKEMEHSSIDFFEQHR